MKTTIHLIFLALIPLLFNQCQTKKESNTSDDFFVEVHNSTSRARHQTLVALDNNQILELIPEYEVSDLIVYNGDQEIPSQINESHVFFIVDKLKPNEKKEFLLRERDANSQVKSYKKRTQAELSVKIGGKFEDRKYLGGDFENVEYLRVPDEHTDHSYYIRYEGPGWESDLVGYRFYLDWRNATDVFGKSTKDVILHQVGLDGFDSYHEMQSWGVDVLKVGNSLGVGSLGTFNDGKAIRVDQTDSVICQILENGVVYSAIKTNYYGWKFADKSLDIQSILSIHGGTRLTHNEITLSGNPKNLCTGIGKDKKARLYTYQGDEQKFGYLATYGMQSLNNDKLGLAVFFSNESFKGFTEDEYSHVVKLRPVSGQLDYYFLGAWEGEHGGIKNEEEFMNYIEKTSIELANPTLISIKEL